MPLQISRPSRRVFLEALASSGVFFTTRGLFAEELTRTPEMTEGPFYPDKLPLDTDNDLIKVNDSITPAVGEITHLTGRVVTSSGNPMHDATIEIWQCDANQVYLHTADSDSKKDQQDRNFQGFGRFTTGIGWVSILPHDQARAVSWPTRSAHSRQGEERRSRAAHRLGNS